MNTITLARNILFEQDLIFFIVSILLTGYANLILSQNQTIRLFYPADATLWRSYSGDTVHTVFVFAVLYIILIPLVYVCELHVPRPHTVPKHRIQKSAQRVALGVLSCTLIAVLFGELGKGYAGVLRPSFARSCLADKTPPYTATTENNIKTVYATDASCTGNTNQAELTDGRRSFPSGHAALAVSGSVYGQLALTRLARSRGVGSDVGAAGVFALGWGWLLFGAWVSASRILDNAHHVADVAVGALLGAWCAVVFFWFVIGRIERDEEQAALDEAVSEIADDDKKGKGDGVKAS